MTTTNEREPMSTTPITIHIFDTMLSTEALRLAAGEGLTRSRSTIIITEREARDRKLRGLRADLAVLHFMPDMSSSTFDELMEQVALVAPKWGIADAHARGLPRHLSALIVRFPYEAADEKPSVVESVNSVGRRMEERFFTAAGSPPPTPEQNQSVEAVRSGVVQLAVLIERHVPAGRHHDRALEDLEAVAMRAIRGIFAPGGQS